MNLLVAVSGGVDSVVLLDMLAQKKDTHRLIVAHFDHGIREDSAADARFVEALAAKYKLPFVTTREELGEQASEALARERRYSFLREQAATFQATIVTAHHQDDLIETIAINLTRGTGWRGVAVFGDKTVKRPLLHQPKTQLYEYARRQQLEWVEDTTNQTDRYLRNRVRRGTKALPKADRQRLIELWRSQHYLKALIEAQLRSQLGRTDRYFYIMTPHLTGIELLRAQTNGALTRRNLRRHCLWSNQLGPIQSLKRGLGCGFILPKQRLLSKTPLTLYN